MVDFDVGDAAPDADEEPADSGEAAESETADQTATPEPEPEPEPSDPADAGPAFEYSEVRQSPLYAREQTWDELEDQLGIKVTPELRQMGIRDDELREVHDALLEVAIDHIDEVPQRLADKRIER